MRKENIMPGGDDDNESGDEERRHKTRRRVSDEVPPRGKITAKNEP